MTIDIKGRPGEMVLSDTLKYRRTGFIQATDFLSIALQAKIGMAITSHSEPRRWFALYVIVADNNQD
jgi:hypothetical protein